MSKLELAKIIYGCNNGQIPLRIEHLFTKHLKHTNTTPDKQLMMVFSYQEFIHNQAKNLYNTEAVYCETGFHQK